MRGLGEDTSPLEQQIQALSKEGAVLDEQHDRKYRGSWKLIDALVELTEDPETAKSLIALRDKLQPGGLLQVNASWIDEGSRCSPTIQNRLPRHFTLLLEHRDPPREAFFMLLEQQERLRRPARRAERVRALTASPRAP